MHYLLKGKRPILITLICILTTLYILSSLLLILFIPQVTFEVIRTHGHIFPVISTGFYFAMLIALYGIWRMRYWGVLLFGIVFIGGSIYGATKNIEFWWGYIPAFVIILVSLFYVGRMS